MTTIAVPGHVPPIPDLTASADASAVTASLRGSGAAVSDVCTTTRAQGQPSEWSGTAAATAGQAMSLFAADADVVVAALEKVTAACDVYVSQVVDLVTDRIALDGRRVAVNRAVDALLADISGADGDDTAAIDGLRSRARSLRTEAAVLGEDIEAFWRAVAQAEDRVIAAFASVDTTAEGHRRAASRSRVDTAALVDDLAGLGGDAEAVNAWWNDLSPAEREALKISDPDLIGNTNGIPSGDRDEANRTSVTNDVERISGIPEHERTDEERAILERALAARAALDLPGSDKDRVTGLPVDVNLLAYQPLAFGGDGAVAVAYGDPDTADNTAVIVPGITNDGTTIASNGADAYRLFQHANHPGDSSAVIAWMGYDAPSWNPQDALDHPGDGLDMGSVVREDRAIRGGALLDQFVDGLRATDDGVGAQGQPGRSHLSVIGHSYGSTTSAHAAHGHGLDADSLTLVGSPGAGGDAVDHARDLGMAPGKVYVGAADNDFVTWLGRDGELGMGRDPAQSEFGANVFGVDPGDPFHADSIGLGVDNHVSYFDEGSQSLDNLTSIVQGEEPDVVPGRTQDANDMATDWLRDEIVHQVDEEVDASVQELRDGWDRTSQWAADRWDDFAGLWP